MFGLTSKPGFNERAVLTNDTRKRLSVMEACMLRVGTVMSRHVDSGDGGQTDLEKY